MMPEPTLGAQILASAMCLHIPAGSDEARGEWATLRALAARADAAERGMVATVEWRRICDRYAPPRDEVLSASDELDNALAAWRALGEVDG